MKDPRFQLSRTNNRNLKNPSRLSQINDSCINNAFDDQEFVQFRPNSHAQTGGESDDSGVCSPPLWKTRPSPSAEPFLSHHVCRSLSPASRLQAITRGQKELMEMVRNMPESSYELSLKDLVEHQHRLEAPPPPLMQQRVKRQASKNCEKSMVRNGSFEMESKGLFLKMVFPFSLQPKKRRDLDRSFSGRVAAKGEVEWWRKKLTGSTTDSSDSSRVSTSVGGSSRSSSGGSSYGGVRKKNDVPRGCWPFFQSKNSKSVD